MFNSWRFQLREAAEALKAGRLAEARRILVAGELQQYLPGQRLAARLAAAFASRACQHAGGHDFERAWGDLETAVTLVEESHETLAARQQVMQTALGAVEQKLVSGDAAGALDLLQKLESQNPPRTEFITLTELARRMQSAVHLSRRGKFADADAQLAAAQARRPDLAVLEVQRRDIREKMEQARPLTEKLHRALSQNDWTEAVSLADQLLALAPASQVARDARRRAWSRVGAHVSDSRHLGETRAWSKSVAHQSGELRGPRYLLWVDGVGGYFMCLADEVVIGQSSPGNLVEIPILGDLSRRHARVCREGEGYWLEPFHLARVNRRSVQEKTLLNDGDELELGDGVRFRFRRPHVLSATARLDFLSRHRTQPKADGVLLMAESCVLGPKAQNHVVCRDWSADVVLYRQDESLCCRTMESIEIDGQFCDGQGKLFGNSHVAGSDFSLSLEELDRCSTQPLR